MADVSHELGSLRLIVDSPLSSKVAMFNNQASQHKQSQLLNPFSTTDGGRVSPKPTFSKEQYGKPLAGSLTESRGQKANIHVIREMLELCQIIDSEGYNVKDEPTMRVIPFGELFNIYNYISDKVVGILLRARKHKLVEFEGEMLFQRRDDNVPVFLLKPILDIQRELDSKVEDIKRASSPAPQATSLIMDKNAHKKKLKEGSLSVPGSQRNSVSRTPSPATSKPTSPTTEAVPAPFNPAPAPATTTEKVENVTQERENISTVTQTVTKANAADAVQEAVPQTDAVVPIMETAIEAQSLTNEYGQPPETPAPISTSNDDTNKIDINNNSATTELPTIVIEASGVHVRNSLDTTENGNAEEVPATVGAENVTI